MNKRVRQYVGLFSAVIAYYLLHEGAHLLYSLSIGAFKQINLMGLGMQIDIYAEKMTQTQLGVFCLLGSVTTLLTAYILIALIDKILGLVQWIKRKSICKVDYDILALGGFYIVTIAAYLFFENVVINYRPVLINGYLEASYPSSTTLLVMCVMPTAVMQFNSRIKNKVLRNIASVTIIAFIAFMVIGRLISGVHWFTDIVGGALLSAGLVMMYYSVCRRYCDKLVK